MAKKEHAKEVQKPIVAFEAAMEALEKELPEIGDIFETLGILVGDVADMVYAPNKEVFKAQKQDCRRTIKKVYRDIKASVYKEH